MQDREDSLLGLEMPLQRNEEMEVFTAEITTAGLSKQCEINFGWEYYVLQHLRKT